MGKSMEGILGKVSLFLEDSPLPALPFLSGMVESRWPFWNYEIFEPIDQVHTQRMEERKDGRKLGCG